MRQLRAAGKAKLEKFRRIGHPADKFTIATKVGEEQP
jgi:hypothetical protein